MRGNAGLIMIARKFLISGEVQGVGTGFFCAAVGRAASGSGLMLGIWKTAMSNLTPRVPQRRSRHLSTI